MNDVDAPLLLLASCGGEVAKPTIQPSSYGVVGEWKVG